MFFLSPCVMKWTATDEGLHVPPGRGFWRSGACVVASCWCATGAGRVQPSPASLQPSPASSSCREILSPAECSRHQQLLQPAPCSLPHPQQTLSESPSPIKLTTFILFILSRRLLFRVNIIKFPRFTPEFHPIHNWCFIVLRSWDCRCL